nr:putative integron gene cassette protein [uncultured bacterium]
MISGVRPTMTSMETLTQFVEVVLALGLLLSPLLLTALAIVIFFRRKNTGVDVDRRSFVNRHILALVSLGLVAGVCAYRWGLVHFCAAHAPTEYYCGLSMALFAAPGAFSSVACVYLFVYIVVTRARH